MVALRSRRLERLFGTRLERLAHAQVADLVTNAVEEAYDLDFKATLYGKSDKERRDLAGDVSALANTAGGVIVLGIAEDTQARAAAAPGVALTDAEVGRVRQVVASQVSPLPTLDVLQVEDPQHPGHGFMLLDRLDASAQTYAVVTLVPDLGGNLAIDMRAMREFRQAVIDHEPLILHRGLSWHRVSVGRRRLVADGILNSGRSKWLACELHESGAGSFAAAVVDRRRDNATASHADDEDVVNVVWSGLRLLARHARDRAAAGGGASARVTVWPVSEQLPARLVHHRFHGIEEALGQHTLTSPPVSEGVFDIDDLAEDGPPLVSATYALTNGVFQEFGHREVLQMTSRGAIRIKYWRHSRPELTNWASAAGVELSDEAMA